MSAFPRIILLPGLDGTGRLFWRLEQALPPELPIEVLTYPIDRPLGYPELIEQVIAAIGDRRVVLLGESFSGPIAIEVAARLPNQIVGLILAATFPTSPLPPFLIRLGSRLDLRLLPRRLIHLMLTGRRADPELTGKIDELLPLLPPAVLAARLRAVADVDAGAALRRVECPTLVLHGRDDILVRPSHARAMLDALPSARMKLLSGPHDVLQCCAREAAREIAAFAATPFHKSESGDLSAPSG